MRGLWQWNWVSWRGIAAEIPFLVPVGGVSHAAFFPAGTRLEPSLIPLSPPPLPCSHRPGPLIKLINDQDCLIRLKFLWAKAFLRV